MTKEEILAMEAGKELNAKVAEEVMGHQVILDEIFGNMERYTDRAGTSIYGPLQPYSDDMSAARQVLERIQALGLEIYPGGNGSEEFEDTSEFTPEEICKAALLAILKLKNDQ